MGEQNTNTAINSATASVNTSLDEVNNAPLIQTTTTNNNSSGNKISSPSSDSSPSVSKDLLKNIDWPFDISELYRIGFNFFKGLFPTKFTSKILTISYFKENESKAFHPSYDQRNLLVAFSLQEKHGKFNNDKARSLGALDFIGHDRRLVFIYLLFFINIIHYYYFFRNAWISLDSMSKAEAQQEFIKLLDTLCPLFRPYVIAVKCDQEEKEQKKKEQEMMELKKQQELEELERQKAKEELRKTELEKQKKYEEQK